MHAANLKRSGGQALAAPGTPVGENPPAGDCRHPMTESMSALADEDTRLIRAFHCSVSVDTLCLSMSVEFGALYTEFKGPSQRESVPIRCPRLFAPAARKPISYQTVHAELTKSLCELNSYTCRELPTLCSEFRHARTSVPAARLIPRVRIAPEACHRQGEIVHDQENSCSNECCRPRRRCGRNAGCCRHWHPDPACKLRGQEKDMWWLWRFRRLRRLQGQVWWLQGQVRRLWRFRWLWRVRWLRRFRRLWRCWWLQGQVQGNDQLGLQNWRTGFF